MPRIDDGPVVEYFAINLRKAREERGLSQAELAQRVKDLGHICTQAIIWKLEQGHREPKLTEVVALGQALDLWSWKELTSQPTAFNLALNVDQWRHRVYALAEQTRAAAAAQLDALDNLAFAVRQAQDAGLPEGRAGGWLEHTPEMTVLREVLMARVASDSRDEEDHLEARILQALETCGVPLVVRPEDITFHGPTPSDQTDATSEDAAKTAP